MSNYGFTALSKEQHDTLFTNEDGEVVYPTGIKPDWNKAKTICVVVGDYSPCLDSWHDGKVDSLVYVKAYMQDNDFYSDEEEI